MSGFSEKQYAINVLRAGAFGYLAKDQARRNSCGLSIPCSRGALRECHPERDARERPR